MPTTAEMASTAVARGVHGSLDRARIIPKPAKVTATDATFTLTAQSKVVLATTPSPELERIAGYLAAILRRSTGFPLPVVAGTGDESERSGNVTLGFTGGVQGSGDGSYKIEITGDEIRLSSRYPDAVFFAVQTLRQLLPPQVEGNRVHPGPWTIPGGTIQDSPRFRWRGAMLDVSRHFFDVDAVKRYIDDISLYKLNVLHLHLSDDLGCRIAIDSWPRLTEIGGRTQVGRGAGGFYTKADYAEIVRYAAERNIEIVPEIDMPGHTNAALSSYAELNCDGKATKPYRGTRVGFSSLCVDADATWRFVDDVIGELAAMTPGRYIHIGGDEVRTLSAAQYARFVERVEKVVAKYDKQAVGWAEIAQAQIESPTVAQWWDTSAGGALARKAVERGARVVMSPASKTYLDMKYHRRDKLGLTWAGVIEVKDAYDWEPATLVKGVTDAHIEGVEAPLWTETLDRIEDVEFMAFPRLAATAEIGWSARTGRSWDDFRARLAAHGPRWKAMGLRYYPSAQIDWEK